MFDCSYYYLLLFIIVQYYLLLFIISCQSLGCHYPKTTAPKRPPANTPNVHRRRTHAPSLPMLAHSRQVPWPEQNAGSCLVSHCSRTAAQWATRHSPPPPPHGHQRAQTSRPAPHPQPAPHIAPPRCDRHHPRGCHLQSQLNSHITLLLFIIIFHYFSLLFIIIYRADSVLLKSHYPTSTVPNRPPPRCRLALKLALWMMGK